MKQKLSSRHFCPAKIDESVQNVGLYFGSFNPVHLGHVALARWVLEHTNLQEIWMVISPQNPFKVSQTLYPNEERFNWVQMAVEDIPGIVACNAEFFMPQPSYTIDTLKLLMEKFPDVQFTLIMGADNVMGFSAWKDYQEIVEKVAILVYPRPGVDVSEEVKKYPSMHLLEDVPLFPISSTQIRELKAQGRDVSEFLPAAVAAVYS